MLCDCSSKAETISKIQSDFAYEMWQVAMDFLLVGLKEFHDRRFSEWQHYQVAVANCCIGIELTVKAFLASKNLSLVFSNLSDEEKAMLTCPTSMPVDAHTESLRLNLTTGSNKTIKFGNALSMMYIFRPDLKSELHSYTKLVNDLRGRAVHGLYPKFERYTAERVAFAALTLTKALALDCPMILPLIFSEGKNAGFLSEFNAGRNDRVKKALKQAQEKSGKLPDGQSYISIDNCWEMFVMKCPVCNRDALLDGYTEHSVEQCDESEYEDILTFFADRIDCDNCGLALEDSKELSLAGITIAHDRSDEIEQWHYDSQVF